MVKMSVRIVEIPKISNYNIGVLEKMLPGLNTVSPVPLIETEERALEIAAELVTDSLVRYECIAGIEDVKTTSRGWTVSFKIFD